MGEGGSTAGDGQLSNQYARLTNDGVDEHSYIHTTNHETRGKTRITSDYQSSDDQAPDASTGNVFTSPH